MPTISILLDIAVAERAAIYLVPLGSDRLVTSDGKLFTVAESA